MDIRTQYICPPIPFRWFDWVAWVDGNEEQGPFGRGATEQEAIAELYRQLEENPGLIGCSYCKHCNRPIRERLFRGMPTWFTEEGQIFCRPAEDQKSLLGHEPKIEQICVHCDKPESSHHGKTKRCSLHTGTHFTPARAGKRG